MRIRRGFNARELLASLAPDTRAYQYRPLPSPTSLRLLEVHHPSSLPSRLSSAETGGGGGGGSGSGSGTLAVSLHTFDVAAAPPFHALSYTWGYPLIPESRPLRRSSWRRLSFLQRVQARASRALLEPSSHDHPRPDSGAPARSQLASAARAKVTEHTPCFVVKCEGRNLRVTANLHDALSMLSLNRLPFQLGTGSAQSTSTSPSTGTSNYIWVDALCIDQASLAERNQQASLMAEIFEAAQGVVLWLGEEDEFTSDAFTESWPDVPYTGFYDSEGTCYRAASVEPLSYKQWLGFIAFMNRPWFKRAWVVQELALAQEVTAVCGQRLLPWDRLATTIEFVRATRWYHHLSTDKMRHIRGVSDVPRAYTKLLASSTKFGLEPVYLNSTRKALQAHMEGPDRRVPSLRTLIDMHRLTDATDPRDKVYAFLSLASRKSSPAPELISIKPDYQTRVQRVYTEAAAALLRSSGDLYLLSHVQDQSVTKIRGLPSWVPDYSVPLHPYPLELRGQCNWSACGDVNWTPPEDEEMFRGGRLPVQGFRIDVVEETAMMPHEATDVAEPWASIVDLVSALPAQYSISSATGSSVSCLDVLWRTLTTNTYSRRHPAPSECGAMFIDYILNLQVRHRLAPWSAHNNEFQPHLTPTSTLSNPDWHGLLAAEPADSPYTLSFYRDRLTHLMENMLFKDSYSPLELAQLHHDVETGSGRVRRLFRTKNLTLLGTGARSLRAGDEIWILAGGRVPYILRQVEAKGANQTAFPPAHSLVGEAYVHGIMHGNPHRFGQELVSTVLV